MRAEIARTPGAGRSIEQAGEQRSARLESVRAIAALAVFVGHVYVIDHHLVAGRVGGSEEPFGTFVDRVFIGGGFGVYLFFVLSGYLLFWPFVRRDYGGRGGVRVGRYAVNRVLRIVPLYVVSVAVLLLLQHDGGSAKQWLYFMTFSENFSTSTFGTVNGVLWSVVVEVHFYLLLPLLALGLALASRGRLGRAALLLGGLGLASFALRFVTFFTDQTPDLLLRYSLPSLFMYFCLGMLLALLRLAWERRPPRRLDGRLGASGLWILAAIALCPLVFDDYRREALIGIAGFLLIGACVLPLRTGAFVRVLEWRLLAAVGVVSYSLYVWHVPLLIDLDRAAWMPFGFTPLLLIATPVIIAVSFLSYAAVERSFLRLRRRWSAAAAQQQPASRPAAATAPANTGKEG